MAEIPSRRCDRTGPGWLLELIMLGNGAANPDDGTFVFEGTLATHPGAQKGARNTTLCHLVGRYLVDHGPDDELFVLALEWGERCTPPYPEQHIRRTVLGIVQKHVAQTSSATQGSAILTRYNTINPQQVEWLWPGRSQQES